MKKLYKISEVLLLILSVFIIHSCENDNIESDIIESDKYLIEMSKDYTISSVTHIIGNNVMEFERSFEYSDKDVKVYTGGILTKTYFLNTNGLADSSNNPRTKYQYSNDNYLVSESNSADHFQYEYSNGNRTKFIWGTSKGYYEYNSLLNIIDIDTFHGSYLGKQNKNLKQSTILEFQSASNGVSITYQYTLNSAGLVIQRIGITTYNSGESPKKAKTDFEYLINE